MNPILIKKAALLSFILGAIIGLVSLLPEIIGYSILFLTFFSSFFVILYLRKDKFYEKLSTKDGTILGSIIGFVATFGFFLSFSPMVCILKAILKEKYYAYAIPDMINMGMWLFFMVVIVVGFVFSLTNSITGMGLAWALDKMVKPNLNQTQNEEEIDSLEENISNENEPDIIEEEGEIDIEHLIEEINNMEENRKESIEKEDND